MTSTTPVPRRYLNILDRHAGREHSEGGSVATALAEILNVHTYDVRADLWRERYGVEHPVQAHNPAGLPWWWHACGDVLGSAPQPQVCLDCDDTRPWRPLLVGGDPAPERQPVDHAFKPGPISSGLCAFKEAGSTCGRAEGHHFHHSAPERDPDMEMPEVQAYSRGFTAGHDSTGGDLIAQIMAELGVDHAEDVLITIQKRAEAFRRTCEAAELRKRQRDEARAEVERLLEINRAAQGRIADLQVEAHHNLNAARDLRRMLDAGRENVERLKAAVKLGQTARAELEGRLREGRGPWPAESGPIVLTLPEVPEGAVALVGDDGARYIPAPGGMLGWIPANARGNGSPVLQFGEILDFQGSVTVEMAPPREPRTKVGDTIKRGADKVPADVKQFVDQRYLRVWSRHPANPPGAWASAQPSVAWGERHLLDECAPLVVTEVID